MGKETLLYKLAYPLSIKVFFWVLFSCTPIFITAQQKTVVKGRVTDALSGEVLPYTNITLKKEKTIVGTTTNENGYYELATTENVDSIEVTFLGYLKESQAIQRGETQQIHFLLKKNALEMHTVVISEKKEKYTKKNNPAVELIEKVIGRKSLNRMENLDYYQFRQHEKMEVSLANITDNVVDSRMLKKVNIIFENLDTAELTQERILPFYFSETLSEKFFRKNPSSSKTYVDAYKSVEFSDLLNSESLDLMAREIFGEINIYDNSIFFLGNQFMSPLAPLAPNFYKFFILDTLNIHDTECYKLGFAPHNTADFGFMGFLFITTDSLYAIKRTELELTKNSQVNYVKQIFIEQEYDLIEDTWVLTKNKTLVDFSLVGNRIFSFYGRKENTYADFQFNTSQPDNEYEGSAKIIRKKESDQRSETYWNTYRISPLSIKEGNIYHLFYRLDSIRGYKLVRDIAMTFISGYIRTGIFDIGPPDNMLSYNSIEGTRFRFGGKTNGKLSPRFFAESYLAYGTRDNKFKYNITGHYSFNKKKHIPWEFPINLLTVSYEYDTKIPGEMLLYGTSDRLTLSLGRKNTEKMTLERRLEVQYKKENINYFTYTLLARHLEQYPLGLLVYENYLGEKTTPYITTSFGINLRYAPNEKFIQSQKNRHPMNMTAPVYELKYLGTLHNQGETNRIFHQVNARFSKRWFISSFGFLDLFLDAGKIFSQVNYPSLFIHYANQGFIYEEQGYNTMRFYEFVSDQYADAQLSYCFNGFIFNRIPLIKKLKWREFITFKALYGQVSEINTPSQEIHPKLMYFPQDKDGIPTTYNLNKAPFMEASIGIDNIFTVLRIDLVKRLNYLNHPQVQEWYIKFRLRFTF